MEESYLDNCGVEKPSYKKPPRDLFRIRKKKLYQ